MKDGNFHLYARPVGLFAAVSEAPDGRIWATRYHTFDDLGPLCEARADRLVCFGQKQGVPFKDAGPLAIERSGVIWLATANRLARWQRGVSDTFAPAALASSEGLEGFKSVIVAPDGTIWSGVGNSGSGLGLQHFNDRTWSPIISAGIDSSSWEVTALLFDRDKTLWVGTTKGIYRIAGGRIDHFGVPDGLSADRASNLFEDHEGNVWVVTSGGIDKFRAMPVISFSSRQGLSADNANAVLATRSGVIWVSNGTALDRIENGAVTTYNQSTGLPGQAPTALFEDPRGRIWIGVDDGVAVFDHGRFTQVHSAGRPIGPILEFASGPDDTVWGVSVTQPYRLVRMSAAEALDFIPAPEGTRFTPLASGPDGSLWLGLYSKVDNNADLIRYANGKWDTFRLHNSPNSLSFGEIVVPDTHAVFVASADGIIEWRDGAVRRFTVDNGLPCARAYALIFDDQGNLWVHLQCGMARIESRQLTQWWNAPRVKLQVLLLDASDGALPGPADFHPRAATAPDGKVWFANSGGLQFVDTHHWAYNSLAPPVEIQTLTGDGQLYDARSTIALQRLTRNVQIDFTALSFVVPERVRFRYKLEGSDRSWQDARNRRNAQYSNLGPGRYTFRVTASNNNGVWNATGASLNFDIPPAFYQTKWFFALFALMGGGLLYGVYRVRMLQVATQVRGRLEARLAERERIARELHDTLLQGVQGLIWRFQAATEGIPPEQPARQEMEKSLDRADKLLAEGRDKVKGLRLAGCVAADLPQALAAEGEQLAEHQSAKFRTRVQGARRELHPIVREEGFLIAREALCNAFRHSEAKHIEAEVTYGETALQVRVLDDGRGIGSAIQDTGGRPGHFGLVGMRERAKKLGGQLVIWSKPGGGTQIDLRVPANVGYRRYSEHGVARTRELFASVPPTTDIESV